MVHASVLVGEGTNPLWVAPWRGPSFDLVAADNPQRRIGVTLNGLVIILERCVVLPHDEHVAGYEALVATLTQEPSDSIRPIDRKHGPDGISERLMDSLV
jgi:hypothetical protein